MHSPLDLVVIALGSNDLKARFGITPFDIARGAVKLAELVLNWSAPTPKVILVSPSHFNPVESPDRFAFEGAHFKSGELAQHYRYFANTLGCGFLDAAKIVTPSELDGLHWESEAHMNFGAAIATEIEATLSET